jgi:three-Cys-motif partner protein
MFSDYLIEQEDGLMVRLASDQMLDGLRLLRAYVDLFSRDVKRKHYIDLWAGTGKIRLTPKGTILLASPLIALTTPKPFDQCYFTEAIDPERMALRSRVQTSDRPYTIYSEDGNVAVDNALEAFKASAGVPLVFLALDRMQVQWASVEKLSQLTEAEFIFDFEKINMSKAPDTTDKQNLWTAFFGTGDWRKVYQNTVKQNGDAHQQLRDFYLERLQSLGLTEQRFIESGTVYQYLAASKIRIRDKVWDAALTQIRQKRLF